MKDIFLSFLCILLNLLFLSWLLFKMYFLIEIELFSQAISDASTLSYAAGLDLDSMNNFAKDEKKSVPLTSSNMPAIVDSSNLEGAKKSIVDAKISMDKILSLLVV